MTVAIHEALDPALYGGKAAALARLINAGLPVPNGLAIDCERVARAGHDGFSRCSLANHIDSQLSVPLAVRSSCIGEDGTDASFAGIYCTKLNVYGREAIARALFDVEASAYSARALDYRTRRGLPPVGRMGIIVQPLINADFSGVMFTRDPHTDEKTYVIETARGLGETIAQGNVTPDRYRLSAYGQSTEHRYGRQRLMARPQQGGGVELVEVNPNDYAIFLSNDTLMRLKKLADDCERVLGPALDIEWAIANEKLWLLQARPITTRKQAARGAGT